MIHFEGDKDLPQPPADLWGRLHDARFLVKCIPDVESVAQADATTATCTVRPGFSFVRGTLELRLQITEATPQTNLRVRVHSKGIGSTSEVEANLALGAQDGGTRIHWTADISQLGGLLKAVPQGLIKAAAQKVISDLWTSLQAQLVSQAVVPNDSSNPRV